MRGHGRTPLKGLAALLVPLLVVVAVVAFARGADTLSADRADEAKASLEDAIRRSCVACYAAEGSYPQSLSHLEERYGLQIDREHYTVVYEPVGSNLMPNFTVLERRK